MIKYKAYDIFINKLGIKDGEEIIYRIAKVREIKCKDLGNIKCIRGEDLRILLNDTEIKER